MTTAAAIDRLVHHSVIIEMTGTSVRADAAEQAKKDGATTTTETPHCLARIGTARGSLRPQIAPKRALPTSRDVPDADLSERAEAR